MPVYAKYWANPEEHRREKRARAHVLAALGVPYRYQLSPAASERREERKRIWCRTHRPANRKAQRKYRRKLQRLFGSSTYRSAWLYHQLNEKRNAEKRKQAIAALPRQLVEGRLRMHLVSSGYRPNQSILSRWKMVLLGRNSKFKRRLRLTPGTTRSLSNVL